MNDRLISRREWRWLLLWTLLIVGVTSLPALVGWLRAPAGWHYTGQVLSPSDGNTYLSKMKQGEAGRWLFSIAYTAEPHEPVLLHPYYILLGHLARLLGLPLGVMFQLARALNAGGLLMTLYCFIARFWKEPAQRRVAFLCAATSSGAGWACAFLGLPTTDIGAPESITFTTLMANPHFPLATLGILLCLMWGLDALDRASWARACACGAGLGALAMIHPYAIVAPVAALALCFAYGWLFERRWSWRAGVRLVAGGLLCLSALWHNLRLYTTPGVWRLWQTQSPPPTPPPRDFLLGYGFLLLLAIIGVLGRPHRPSTAPLLLWMLGVGALIFAPIPPLEAIQVRFSEGLHIPIALLAAQGMFALGERMKARVWGGLLPFLALTNCLVLLSALWRMNAPEAPWFYPQDDVAAMRWLDEQSRPEDVALTLDWTGNYLPAEADLHVYVGHLYETIDFAEKRRRAEDFFSNRIPEAEAAAFLAANGVDWVFVGRQELSAGFDPALYPYLTKVFEQGDAAVYRVDLLDSR